MAHFIIDAACLACLFFLTLSLCKGTIYRSFYLHAIPIHLPHPFFSSSCRSRCDAIWKTAVRISFLMRRGSWVSVFVKFCKCILMKKEIMLTLPPEGKKNHYIPWVCLTFNILFYRKYLLWLIALFINQLCDFFSHHWEFRPCVKDWKNFE